MSCIRNNSVFQCVIKIMFEPPNPKKKIDYVEGLIARTEKRVQKIQARAEPGATRMVHALTNKVRQYRRDLHKLHARQPDLKNQKLLQHRQMLQAQNNAYAKRGGELPAKQDQEPRKPASRQGVLAGQ